METVYALTKRNEYIVVIVGAGPAHYDRCSPIGDTDVIPSHLEIDGRTCCRIASLEAGQAVFAQPMDQLESLQHLLRSTGLDVNNRLRL